MRRQTRTVSDNGKPGVLAAKASRCVAEVMGTDLFTLTPDTVVASALRLAGAKEIHHFLVIEDGSLAGIVCETDLVQARGGSLVRTCMKSPVLCISPETTVDEAADIMSENAVGCLPVVTGTFLVGVVTRDRVEELTGKNTHKVETFFGEEPDEEVRSCAACGAVKGVTAHARAGLLDLCPDCAAIMPKANTPGSN